MRGTPFQKNVWKALLAIPFGETRTYGDLAKQLGAPAASRAVGAANGRNPISIVVPCNRVIGASGKRTGFAGGLETKAHLLELESGRLQLGAADARMSRMQESICSRSESSKHFIAKCPHGLSSRAGFLLQVFFTSLGFNIGRNADPLPIAPRIIIGITALRSMPSSVLNVIRA
jgi:O-6-methylguanine DNA methyltransferase